MVRVRPDRTGMIIEVSDEGAGMAPDVRERVFDRFHTDRPGGVGLGLSIVRKLARADRGDVTLHEGPRGGLAVRIRLPHAHTSAGS